LPVQVFKGVVLGGRLIVVEVRVLVTGVSG